MVALRVSSWQDLVTKFCHVHCIYIYNTIIHMHSNNDDIGGWVDKLGTVSTMKLD